MMKDKQLRETRKAELVETHNIALSLTRLQAQPYDAVRWKRALYHAVAMCGMGDSQVESIRKALGLP